MLNNRKPSRPGQHDTSPVLKRARKNIYKQALLAGLLIVLTVVVLFAGTAAWYTNIVQSSGLVFEASAWGFEGDVTLTGGAISVAPGDEGVVELTARSDSSELTAVSLNVSRAQMSDEICKRIFFYIDTSKVRNGETMDRIYLGSQDSYTYLLFGRQTLLLTETVHNDAPLKWHWVYDVLGYYVQGTYDGVNGIMSVSEYLRPLEYEFDEAKTTFLNGQLATIDGSTTVEDFLLEQSRKDGYPGEIDTADAVTVDDGKRIYYPVAVDATGSGVWAYLCTYSEIMTNTEYDTALGKQVAQGTTPTYTAAITISAQNSKLEAVQVSTPAALLTQIEQASGTKTVIRLEDDITLSEPLVIGGSETQQVMLDLNGKTLMVDPGDYSANGAAIQVAAGSGLTMTNGSLVGSGDGYAIDGAGAEITLSGVTISGVKRALNIRDNSASNTRNSDAKIHLVDCRIESSDAAVLISGNGTDSAQTTQLVVEGTTIESDYIGIAFNGSADQWGTSTQIINSNIYGYWAGVYHPQGDGTLVISGGSTISGYTGMVLKGGNTTVLDSTIHGTGEQNVPTSVSMSGFHDTGDGIYIESNYGWEILLKVSGDSTVISDHAQELRVYPDDSNVKVTINGSRVY